MKSLSFWVGYFDKKLSSNLLFIINVLKIVFCKGHSTRAAATSEAADSDVPLLQLVLEAADWSSAGTFEKRYHKQTTSRGKFAKSVLGSHKN